MLKKEFYDTATVVGFVLMIGISILISKITSLRILKNGVDIVMETMIFFQLLVWGIVFIYWIFALVLSIKLYEKKSLNLVKVALVAILIPFAPIVYLTLLRKPLTESPENNNSKKKKLGNIPGTP